jgi:FkbM family methyltransferase
VLIHYDAWAIGPEAVTGLATAGWTPVHSDGMSVGDRRFYMLSGAQPIAYSRWGETKMREAGFAPVYVPHGVDTSIFRPLADDERAKVRRMLGIPESRFVISVVAANKGTDPPRKAWGEHFEAFAQFHRRHRDAMMLVHSMAAAPEGWGLDMRPLLANLGIADAVMFSDDYAQVTGLYSHEYIAHLIGCSDVLSNPSYGEGFGLAALQAQACGIPVIVGDNSAQTELCGAGWLVGCQRYWHNRDEAWWHTPLIKSITACFDKAYRARGDKRLRERARRFAMGYDADLITDRYWRPALDMLSQLAGAERVRWPTVDEYVAPLPTQWADGLEWLARGPHTDDWIAVGHEDALAPVLDGLLPAGGVFVDVGAHVGRWAIRMARKASFVFAVEANPDTAAVLRYNLELNSTGNVEVIAAAAWDTRAKLALDKPRAVTSGSTRVGEGEGEVDAAPLDDLLLTQSRPGQIDLIKLDVEGADLHALRGMGEILRRYHPVLFIEDHSIYGYYEQNELDAALAGLGYSVERFTAHLPGDRVAPYVIARPLPADDLRPIEIIPLEPKSVNRRWADPDG